MTRQVGEYKKCFTLIEIIIVIAILTVLSAIVLPNFLGLTERARIKADQASLDSLNNATMLFSVSNNIYSDDIFATSPSNEERMLVLVNDGLLQKIIKTQQKDARFSWNVYTQKWVYDLAMTEKEAKAEGFNFQTDSITGRMTITKYEGSEKDIKIPYKIGGEIVKEIKRGAFNGKGLTSLIIPSGVETLEYSAFANNQLTSVVLSDTIRVIGHYAFKNTLLKLISFPSSMKVYGKEAFENNQLEEITIPSLEE